MTAPDRIYVYVAGSPVLPVLRQEWLLEPSEIAVTVEYIRADLARTPLAEAHPLAAEARTALERDDVAGWIGSLPKAPLAEALAVPEVKALNMHKLAERLVPMYQTDRAKTAALCDEVLDPSGALLGYLRDAALRAIGEGK